jgi:hypothetical protein
MVFGYRLALATALLASACQHDSNADFDDGQLPSAGGATSSDGGSAPEPGASGAADDAGGSGSSTEAGTGAGGTLSAAGTAGKPAAEGGKAGQGSTGQGGSQAGSGMAGKGGGPLAGTGGKPEPDPAPVTVQIHEFEDATVFSCEQNHNDGDGVTLQTDYDVPCVTRALLNPVLTDIPAGVQINQATLSLVCVNPGSGDVAVAFATERKWTESTVKYANRPSVGELIQNVSCESDGDVVSIDLTDAVTAWLDGQAEPLGIYLMTEVSDGTDFASSEADKDANRPLLEVTYTLPKK